MNSIRNYKKGRKYTTIEFFDVVDARDCGCYDRMQGRLTNEDFTKMQTLGLSEMEERRYIETHLA